MFGLILIIPFAKMNDHFDRPWAFAGIYIAIAILLSLFMGGLPSHWFSFILSALIKFALVGALFKVLSNYQDTIFKWFGILFAGIFIIHLIGV